MDRTGTRASGLAVALLAEGVDRNNRAMQNALSDQVALLAEGVDRNHDIASYKYQRRGSPSSRRAWIEIELPLP